MNPFETIIQKYFPDCSISQIKKFDEEYLAEITIIEIQSKFSPILTAYREWNMVGELVQLFSSEELRHLQIRAIV